METVTLANPVAVGFWFTVGCTLAGIAMAAILAVIGIAVKALLG